MTQKTKTSRIVCPADVGKFGKAEFKRIKPELLALGYLSIDKAILDCYLTSYNFFCEAKDHIKSDGVMIVTSRGQVQINPWHTVMRQHQELLKKCMSELGFSVGSRKRLSIEPATEQTNDDLY